MGKTFLKANQVQLDRQIIIPRTTFGGMVTFWFDDGAASDYTVLRPLFAAQGEVGALSIVTDIADGAGGLTWAQAHTMEDEGWEITNHTKTHTHLTTYTESEIVDEFEDSQARFIANGITPTILAYPYNASNFLVKKLARKYFRAARGTQGNTINKPTLDTFNLASVVMDDWTLLTTYEACIDEAVRTGKWIIFYGHSGAYEAGDLEDLNELIDYAQSLGVDIVTPSQALTSFENYVDYGDGLGVNEKQIRMNAQTISPTFEDNGGAATVSSGVAIGPGGTIEFDTSTTAKITLVQPIEIWMTNCTFMFEFLPFTTTDQPYLFNDSATGHYIRYRGSLGALYLYESAEVIATWQILDTSFISGTLKHVAIVMNANKATCYVDGVLIGESSTTFTGTLNMNQIVNTSNYGLYMNNIRLFNTSMTQQQVWDEMYSDYAVNNDNLIRQFKGKQYIGTSASPTHFANIKQFDLLLQ